MKGCRPLSDEEWWSMFNSVEGMNSLRTKALMMLGRKTGFRVSELLSLRIGDLVNGGKPVSRVTVLRRNRKGGKAGRATSMTVPLHSDVHIHILNQWWHLKRLGYWRLDDYFFQSRTKGNIAISRQTAWSDFNKAVHLSGLEGQVGTHGPMRKTFARDKLDHLREKWRPGKEMPFQTLQRCTGHKSVDALMSYIEFSDEDVEDAFLNS